MADALKLQFGPAVVTRLASEIHAVHDTFDVAAFERDALHGFDAMELLERGRHLGAVLQQHLPQDFGEAVDVLLASVGDGRAHVGGMSSFHYLPHTEFVRQFGVPHFAHAMRALHALTQVFTGEFAVRPLLEQHQDATLARLHEWTRDPNEHVRRLVSEGSRPRLPWAPRLRAFQRDPAPVLRLLEILRDDASLYVRRSVANNLNDIGKDHPALLVETTARWTTDATEERRWVIRHALRGLVRRGDTDALAVLGFADAVRIDVVGSEIVPADPVVGGKVVITVLLRNATETQQRAVVDLRVHFVKANGSSAAKVFKLAAVELDAGSSVSLRKTITLAQLTTRRHYPGQHRVDLQMNGVASPLGAFTLRDATGSTPQGQHDVQIV